MTQEEIARFALMLRESDRIREMMAEEEVAERAVDDGDTGFEALLRIAA